MWFVVGAADDRVFYARDMETLEEGANAEKNKNVGRSKDSAAGVPGGGEANAIWVGRSSGLQCDDQRRATMRHAGV